MEMRKTQMLMSKPLYLGLSIKELGKTLMYEFWYDYVKPKYREKAKLCYMDTDRSGFTVYIKTNYIYKYIAEDVDKLAESFLLQIMNQIDHCLKKNLKV